MASTPPRIGMTADADDEMFRLRRPYVDMVTRAGATPLILPCVLERVDEFLDLCDGFILTGGDDPDTRQWGVPLHPAATPIDPDRQAFEWAMLERLDAGPVRPVLGVCLGMQLMSIFAGGTLEQYLPETLATAAEHWGRRTHPVDGALGRGLVLSHHRQAVTDPGGLTVIATAPDGVIEAVRADDRPFYVGVQWHPERTEDEHLGYALVRDLVLEAASS